MPLRVGLLTAAHLHVWGYLHCLQAHPDAEVVGVWDFDSARGADFAAKAGIPQFDDLEALFAECDAVGIVSENRRHAELGIAAAKAGKHILCEKPLTTTVEDGERFIAAAEEAGVVLMTAFPCRFAPSWTKVKEKVRAGEIGTLRAICATNRGRCPFGWFVNVEESGGGAMIDHVVHVGDLLRDLLQADPITVQAQTGNNIYGQEWEDTAMVTMQFPDGVFATLDSSWSRPKTYYTWGDVTMNLVGEKGVIELDMFGPHLDVTGPNGYGISGYGSNADAAMINEFVAACTEKRTPVVTGRDGLQAAKIALAGFESVRRGEAVAF